MIDVHPRCFVLMPFRDELVAVYRDAIQTAASEKGFVCERADDITHPGVVLAQIDARIEQASVVIVDLTDRNPNVMQELGFARCAQKQIVLITQGNASALPFDVRHYRVLTYEQSENGLTALRASLARVLAEIRASAFSAQALTPRDYLQVGYEWFKKNIEPQLIKDGNKVVYAGFRQADQYRLEGWEYVTYVDPHDHVTKILRTEELVPLVWRGDLAPRS